MRRLMLPVLFLPAMVWAEEGGQVGHLKQLGAAIQQCWAAPAKQDNMPQDATVRFALRADGTLMGEPQITYAHWGLSEEAKKDYIASVRAAIQRCAPYKLKPSYGHAVAGRPITIRFTNP